MKTLTVFVAGFILGLVTMGASLQQVQENLILLIGIALMKVVLQGLFQKRALDPALKEESGFYQTFLHHKKGHSGTYAECPLCVKSSELPAA